MKCVFSQGWNWRWRPLVGFSAGPSRWFFHAGWGSWLFEASHDPRPRNPWGILCQ